MERYDYNQHVTDDIYNYFMNEMTEDDRFWLANSTYNDDYEVWFNKLREDDSITGLSSGSYTMNKAKAEENLLYNWDLAAEAYMNLFMDSCYDVLDKGPELLDAWVRYYVYPYCFDNALNRLRKTINGDD